MSGSEQFPNGGAGGGLPRPTVSNVLQTVPAGAFVPVVVPIPGGDGEQLEAFLSPSLLSGGSSTITGSAISAAGGLLGTNNLSDLRSAPTARINLGLGSAALATTGTAAGNVPVIGGSGTLPTAIIPAPVLTSAEITAAGGIVGTVGTAANDIPQIGAGGVLPASIIPPSATVPITSFGTAEASQALAFGASGDVAYEITVGENMTLALSGGATGVLQKLTVLLIQNSTGGYTVTLPSNVNYASSGAPTVGLGAGQATRLVFENWNGTYYGGV